MAKPRVPRAEAERLRREKRAEEELVARGAFVRRVSEITTYDDARTLLHRPGAPGPDRPGRGLYTAWDFFFLHGGVPMGASEWELGLYADFLHRARAAGGISPQDHALLVGSTRG
jgi:hypothetical protein